MRPLPIVLGLIGFVIGAGLAWAGWQTYIVEQSFAEFSGVNYAGVGSIEMGVGIVLAVVGIIILTYGFDDDNPVVAIPVAVPVQRAVSQPPRTLSNSPGLYCPFCGAPIVAGASFCRSCGRSLPS